MKKHRAIKTPQTIPGILVFGILFSFAALFIISAILAGLIMSTSNPSGNIKTVSLAALLISGAISGFVISKRKGDGGIVTSLLTSLIFVGLIIIIALISSKGKVSGVVFMNCICYALISIFTSFLAKKRPRRHKR